MKYRTFHINRFPKDRIFVEFNKQFHKKLFKPFSKRNSFKILNKKYFNNKLSKNTFKNWKSRKTFIPLWFILRLSKILNISLKIIKRNIISYKGPSSSTPINEPNLPLIEDERLLKIMAHLLGDGHVDGAFGTNLPKGKSHSEYKNYNDDLLDRFEKDLKVFGNIKTSKDYEHHHLIPPNVIGYILKYIYKIEFDTFNSEVPKSLFKLDKKFISAFLRAFADDEAHVYDQSIEFYSANKNLLMGIFSLFKERFREIPLSNFRKSKFNNKYYFSVLRKGLPDYNRFIGFDSPKKSQDLAYNLKRSSTPIKKYKNGIAKQIILSNLSKENCTSKQLSRKLGICHTVAINHLKDLENLNKVKILNKNKFSYIWTINSHGL